MYHPRRRMNVASMLRVFDSSELRGVVMPSNSGVEHEAATCRQAA
jgi:hypothetical protein